MNKETNQPPYVSDDFQIGPNGAYEHNKTIQIIDEAYKNYETIHKHAIRTEGDRNQFAIESLEKQLIYPQEEFINKCKTDSEFSENWGLQIEERELSLEERHDIKEQYGFDCRKLAKPSIKKLDDANIPTKLITITYNNERIESYE